MKSTGPLAVAVVLLALALPGVAAPPRAPVPKPITAADSFERHFNTPLPKKVRVVHYYGETFGMDPSFAWGNRSRGCPGK